jgi:Cys-tRNA synthase (O-phospho-L-seryl-tRNA:Cys-tRNA synthase)
MEAFFQKITDVLDELRIPYMLSGSIAMGIYIVPRATRDFDFIVHLLPSDVERFTACFKGGYYCDKEAVADAI